MATPKVKHYTVKGSHNFPIDMLRYDVSWPQREEDALNIIRTYDSPFRESIRSIVSIRLTTHHPFSPTVGRWESFGWKVEKEA